MIDAALEEVNGEIYIQIIRREVDGSVNKISLSPPQMLELADKFWNLIQKYNEAQENANQSSS